MRKILTAAMKKATSVAKYREAGMSHPYLSEKEVMAELEAAHAAYDKWEEALWS